MRSPCLLVLLAAAAVTGSKLGQYDTLRVARCVAKCSSPQQPANKDTCVEKCLVEPHRKPGECPHTSTLSVFDAACIEACHSDPECSSTDKCCAHSCGVTCQKARGLDTVPGLPPVPCNVSVGESRRGRTVLVEWTNPGPPGDKATLLYVLEERQHVGRHFSPARLGKWAPRHRSARTSAYLKNTLRPGRWYQFRVASVNSNGTRGFSEPSKQFTLSIGPKAPGPPLNLEVGPLTNLNGTLWGELRWEPPVSDLPVQRYKVFWSLKLEGATSPLMSVLVNHQTVSRDITRFSLKHLQPNSLYFLQVQALAQFGRDRLRGEKAGKVLNTTGDHRNGSDAPISAPASGSRKGSGRVEGLKVQRMFWARGQLLARVTWQQTRDPKSRFTVSWWPGPCLGDGVASNGVQLASTTSANQYDLYDLNFRCKYRVAVRETNQNESALMFTTPSCEDVAASQLHDKPKCT